MGSTQVNNVTDTVLVGETVYGDLPISVRVLIAAYATPIPSGNEGVFSFEVKAEHWDEIKSELTRIENAAVDRSEGFVLVTYFANDYSCPHDNARWTRCNCSSAESDECPICSTVIEPVASDRYTVIRHPLESAAACGPTTEPVTASVVSSEPAWHSRVLGEGGGEH